IVILEKALAAIVAASAVVEAQVLVERAHVDLAIVRRVLILVDGIDISAGLEVRGFRVVERVFAAVLGDRREEIVGVRGAGRFIVTALLLVEREIDLFLELAVVVAIWKKSPSWVCSRERHSAGF